MVTSPGWRAEVPAALTCLALGAVSLRLAVTREYLAYIRADMGIWLGLAGAVVVLIAGWTLLRWLRDRPGATDEHPSRVQALVLVPLLVLLCLPPTSSGQFFAQQVGSRPPPAPATQAALPDDPIVAMDVATYVDRTYWRQRSDMVGRRFRILGFVAPGKTPGTWLLGRQKVSCCAADALTFRVELPGDAPSAAWVEAVIDYAPPSDQEARGVLVSATPVPAPADPYLR